MASAYQKILVYLALTFAFSAVFYHLMISSGAIGQYTFGLMCCPGMAGVLTQLIFQHNLRGMGWRLSKAHYLLMGYGLPLLYCLVTYGLVWLTGLGQVDLTVFIQRSLATVNIPGQSPVVYLFIYLLIMTTLALAMSCINALGEEIGWRGLLVPELSKITSFTKTSLISGAIWVLWHSPLMLFANYNNADTPTWYSLLCFTVLVLASSFVFTWLRLKSGSLWPVVLLHASHNLFIQHVFTPLTLNTGATAYWIDEFGIGLAIALGLLGYLFWRLRGALPPKQIG